MCAHRYSLRFASAFALSLYSSTSLAEPIRTWGGQLTPPESIPSPSNQEGASDASPPPPPPPATLGVPFGAQAQRTIPDESTIAAESSGDGLSTSSDGTSAIVRAPGRIGLRYYLEGIEIRGNRSTLSRVILRYVPFHAGDTLDVDDKELELTRFRLLGTGFFRDVQLSLRRGSRRGQVILVVRVAERNTIVVNDIWLGLSADAEPNGAARPLTAYGGIDVAEVNLGGTGMTLGGALALADGQIALRTRFIDPQFLRSSWTVDGELLYTSARDFFGNKGVLVDDPSQKTNQDFAVVNYRRFGGVVGTGHDLGISSRVSLGYRIEKIDAQLPRAASHRRGLDIEPIDFQIFPGSSILSTVRARLVRDTRDEPVLPTRGAYITALVDTALAPLGSDYTYSKFQARAMTWTQLSWGHVMRFEAFGGAIFGQAPMFEKFYVGDFSDFLPDRVLDLNFDRRAAPNLFGTDIAEVRYGQYAFSLSTEYRIPVYRGLRSVYGIDMFGSTGVYGVANDVDIQRHARGYSGLSVVPIDMTINLGLRIDTSAGAFTFGLSNFLGFIPVRGQSR